MLGSGIAFRGNQLKGIFCNSLLAGNQQKKERQQAQNGPHFDWFKEHIFSRNPESFSNNILMRSTPFLFLGLN
jgi:hypothetical protein